MLPRSSHIFSFGTSGALNRRTCETAIECAWPRWRHIWFRRFAEEPTRQRQIRHPHFSTISPRATRGDRPLLGAGGLSMNTTDNKTTRLVIDT
jgi:hypothetical protein